jgi:hypothetical protein
MKPGNSRAFRSVVQPAIADQKSWATLCEIISMHAGEAGGGKRTRQSYLLFQRVPLIATPSLASRSVAVNAKLSVVPSEARKEADVVRDRVVETDTRTVFQSADRRVATALGVASVSAASFSAAA